MVQAPESLDTSLAPYDSACFPGLLLGPFPAVCRWMFPVIYVSWCHSPPSHGLTGVRSSGQPIHGVFFEDLTLGSAPVKTRMWKWYVYDTCCIVTRGNRMAEELLDHLNSVRPSIQFTLELEREGSLPFLDTLLRREDGTLDNSVYRKLTHTDRYLHFRSHHPAHVRRGLVRCLYNRARIITTSPDSLRREEDHLER